MTISAQHSGDIIRKASKATVVLQGFAVLLLLGLIYIFVDISQRYTSLQDGVRENALWSVYQLDRESRRLHETMHVMIVEGDFTKAAMKELSTRYDILYSRMNILKKANFEQKFRLDEGVAEQLEEIQASVFGNQAVFDDIAAGKPVDEARLASIEGNLDEMVKNTERLLGYTNNSVSTQRAEVRDTIMTLQLKSAGLVGLLVVSVAILIVSLRRQLKSVRLAGLTLETISNKLTSALIDAEAGNRAKSQFMATMGHEIRTPLNAILGTAELLELSNLPAAIEPSVQTIRRSGNALLEIINEILDFAKIEHGKLDIEVRPVDVRSVAAATVEIVRDRATEHRNQIVFSTPQTLTAPVIATDPTRLRQVLLNLLSNAIKFTSDGTVTLRMKELGVAGERILRFEISDTGIGIDEDGLDKLFRPFSQVDSSISRKYGGTGLGLTICKQIIETMGGQIGVESTKGRGSTFWFDIPAVAAEMPLIVSAAVETPESSTDLPALNILVVEDNVVNQQVAAGFLKHLGQRVTIANDGLEAVEAAGHGTFDLILMDMQMPRLDGIEATRRIRGSGGSCSMTPIIAMTANASDDDRMLCAEAGMTGFQSKPVTLKQLRDIVETHFQSPPAAEGSTDASELELTDAFNARKSEIIDALGEETFVELLSSFFDDASSLLRELHTALGGNDYRDTDRLLHTLKGAASSIGLQDVADFSQSLRGEDFSEVDLMQLENNVLDYKNRLAA